MNIFSSKGSQKKDEAQERRKRTRTVSSTNLKVTFENLVAAIKATSGDSVDKVSVANMLNSIYYWIVFDASSQIDLPTVPGSGSTSKMWPHGATVDTRRGSVSSRAEGSSRRLEDLDISIARSVSKSVVSSTVDDDETSAFGTEASYMSPTFQHHPIVRQSTYPQVSQRNPMDYLVRNVGQIAINSPKYPSSHASDHNDPHGNVNRVVPGYAMTSAAPPPERVGETPEIPKAQIKKSKPPKALKVGAVERNMTEVSGGPPVSFPK